MVWWNPMSWGQVPTHPSPDLSDFERAWWSSGELTSGDLVHLASYGLGCRADTAPLEVPLPVLDSIGFHPVVYAGESVVASPSHDPDLYFFRLIRGGDKRTLSELEAWLRPLLILQRAPLLEQIARGFAYGSVPIVFDYGMEDLTIKVPSEVEESRDDGEVKKRETERNKNLPNHVHYVRSHELWPGDANLRVQKDRLVGVLDVTTGIEYGGEDLEDPGQARAFLSVWDPQFGRWRGHGSRRRVYKDWFEEAAARLWEIRYIERSVDLPRVGYAPEGKVTIGGQAVSAIKLLRAQLMSLRGGSALTLPSTLAGEGQPAWRVQTLEGGDRQQIFQRAIDARAARMLQASLVVGGKVDKATEEQAMDSVQRVCNFAAATLTRVANVNLRLRYGKKAPLVQVLANDVPKRKLRLVQQVFSNVSNATQHLDDGRVYTLGELVHPEIIEQLGIKARSVEEAAHEPVAAVQPPGAPGRPIELASDREERRDGARTLEGEQDTGGKDQEREERE